MDIMLLKEEKLKALRSAAKEYAIADKLLEDACGEHSDPIACTVFALKGRNTESIPKESFPASKWLSEVVSLHAELVGKFRMDNDEVRKVWFPILNREHISN